MKPWFGSFGMAAVVALAALPAAAREPSPSVLRNRIDRIADRAAFAPAFWGIEVRSLKTGKVLYVRNAGKNLSPASTLKLVVTAAALDRFGPAATLQTTVKTAGRLDALGRVLGDVYLVGGGDPGLSWRSTPGRPAAFEKLGDDLRAAGIRRIEGRVVGHEGLFKGDRRGEDWGWGDLVWCYGAEVSALSFGDNCASLEVAPGERPGDPAVVERHPVSSYYSVVSAVTTSPAGTEKNLTLVRDLGGSLIRLSGAYPLGERPEELNVALEDPARFAATVFAEVLESKGIRVAGPVATSSDPLPGDMTTLASHDSLPLAEILRAVNKPSLNLHTEMLLRLLGARLTGEGSVAAGHDAVKEFLGRMGVASESWALQDGSGLSRTDLVTAHDLVTLLAAMDRHPHARVFKDSLPVAGIDGTLRGRMRGTPAEGRIVAKTGSFRQANSLAGYATLGNGERLVFAILVNHHTVSNRQVVAAIDEMASLLVGP